MRNLALIFQSLSVVENLYKLILTISVKNETFNAHKKIVILIIKLKSWNCMIIPSKDNFQNKMSFKFIIIYLYGYILWFLYSI